MNKLLILLLLHPATINAGLNDNNIRTLFTKAEQKYQLPNGILGAIAIVESNNNPLAFVKEDGRTRKSSYGILQLQLAAARQVGFKGKAKELLNTKTNIEYGARYLAWLLKVNRGDVAKSLIMWNAGPNSLLAKKPVNYLGKILNEISRTPRR